MDGSWDQVLENVPRPQRVLVTSITNRIYNVRWWQPDEQQERRVIRLQRSNIQSFNEFQVTFNLMAKFFTIFVQKLRNRVSLRTSCRRNVTSWRGKMKTAASVSRWHGRWPTTSRRGKLDDSGIRSIASSGRRLSTMTVQDDELTWREHHQHSSLSHAHAHAHHSPCHGGMTWQKHKHVP